MKLPDMHVTAQFMLAVVLWGFPVAESRPALPAGWHVFASGDALSASVRHCANRSSSQWRVSAVGGDVRIEPHDLLAPRQPDALWPSWLRHRSPDRAIRLGPGWLSAVDRGEFPGGGLWWAGSSGERGRQLLSRNVQDVRRVSEKAALAFAGLAHLSVNWGAVVAVRIEGTRPETRLLGRLDGMAEAVSEGGEPFLAVTEAGVWEVWADKEPQRLVSVDLFRLIPRTVARVGDGTIYVGLSLFVLRLVPVPGGYDSEWLLPDACVSPGGEGAGCACQ